MVRPVAAFLRGINVGGNKKIDMATLRDLTSALGYKGARTHLQSGNLAFVCDGDLDSVSGALEDAIAARFGFDCRVIVRDGPTLAAAIATDPLARIATNTARHLLGFLDRDPSPEATKEAETRSSGDDLVKVVGRHLYMWCPAGVSASPLAKVNFDRVLAATVTLRNWNTATKMAEILDSL